MKLFTLAAVACAAAIVGTAAHAGAITTYSSVSAFNAAVGAGTVTVEDFTSTYHFPISGGVLNSATNVAGITPGTIKPGVTYSTPVGSGNFFNIDAGGGFAGGFLDTVTGGSRVLTITFDGPVQMFGFDTNELVAPGMSMIVDFEDGSHFSTTVAPTSMEFFGFGSSAQDITSIHLSGRNSAFSFALDNFRFSDVGNGGGTVPEPGSLALLGLALAAARVARQRKAVA